MARYTERVQLPAIDRAPHPFHRHLAGAGHSEQKVLCSGSSPPGRRQRLNWAFDTQSTKDSGGDNGLP